MMAHYGATPARYRAVSYPERIIFLDWRHYRAANVKAKIFWLCSCRIVWSDTVGLTASDRRQSCGFAPFDETCRSLIYSLGFTVVRQHGNLRLREINNLYIHGLCPCMFLFRNALVPICPSRLFAKLARCQTERMLEGTAERFRILKAGVQCNVDDFFQGVECQ